MISDDAVVAPTIYSQTLMQNFIARWEYNGRIFTDVLANLFYRMPLVVWKLFDVSVYIAIALLTCVIFTENRWKDIAIVCTLILLFPMNYLSSAGYIATSTNYVYPVACLLTVMYQLFTARKRKQIPWLSYPIMVTCVLYITNHDQSGMVLIGGLFIYLFYCIGTREDKKIICGISTWLAFSVICYALTFVIPGHIYRMTDTSEMEHWFPQYATWTLTKKVYHGFSTTIANFLFSDVKVFALVSILLFILTLSQGKIYNKIVAAVPLAVMLTSDYIGIDKFIVYYDYSCGMPDLIPPSQNIIPLILSVVSVCSIFFIACNCMSEERKYLVLMLLILASGSREMMGFSATLYASSFRTFTFFLYAVIACCLLMLQDLKKKNEHLYYVGLGIIASMLIL